MVEGWMRCLCYFLYLLLYLLYLYLLLLFALCDRPGEGSLQKEVLSHEPITTFRHIVLNNVKDKEQPCDKVDWEIAEWSVNYKLPTTTDIRKLAH